jgi:trans-2,3-dihydro-3-hydroxyanthranilate isomerase
VSGASTRTGTTAGRGTATGDRLVTPQAWLYSSFADGLGGGNPAGVVVTAEPLAGDVAQAVAAVLSVPTTGFVVAPEPGARTVAVRFFTPEREIDACGHVTVAVAAALVEEGVWSWGDEVSVRAAGGDFPLRLRDGATEMTQRLRLLEQAAFDWETIAAALGPVARHPLLPLAVAGTGLRHLIVPLVADEQLAAIDLDAGRVAGLAFAAGVETICVWAPTVDPRRIRMRDLCAAIGGSRSRPRARPPPRWPCTSPHMASSTGPSS